MGIERPAPTNGTSGMAWALVNRFLKSSRNDSFDGQVCRKICKASSIGNIGFTSEPESHPMILQNRPLVYGRAKRVSLRACRNGRF